MVHEGYDTPEHVQDYLVQTKFGEETRNVTNDVANERTRHEDDTTYQTARDIIDELMDEYGVTARNIVIKLMPELQYLLAEEQPRQTKHESLDEDGDDGDDGDDEDEEKTLEEKAEEAEVKEMKHETRMLFTGLFPSRVRGLEKEMFADCTPINR